ncbi:hypothetical protein GOBAR_DD36699 [Gossypium barbadense]|nr:hypothetical protein GOBAR_DD36699 [Gossypium barbadense]
MAEVLQNPHVLLKVKKELDQVIGKGKPIEESDINSLPYLQAIIKETFRMHPPVPLLLPRRAGSDTDLCGFHVPEGSQVLVNAWAIGRDSSIWENPNSFMPERFLGSEIDVKGRDFGLIPFGAGRRICPGLPLANRMLYLMLGSLINSFDWKLEVDLVDPNSARAQEFRKAVYSIMVEAGKPNLADYFPLLRKMDPQGVRRRMTVHFDKLLKLFGNMMDERQQSRKSPDYTASNDVLDTLLDIIEGDIEELNKDHIKHLFLVLFVAGTDTTSNTLEWAMAEVLQNPHVLLKVKKELDQVIGKGKPIEESDINSLPYLQAIIKETFRMHPPVPLLLPRRAGSDTDLCGFHVPEGSQVLVNAWAIGRDSSIWENPNSFMPERFLGSEIDVKGRDFGLIPFGAGRRICPGLPLANRMLYLMLGSLINSFDWKLEGGISPKEMNMEEKFGLTVQMAEPLQAIPVVI